MRNDAESGIALICEAIAASARVYRVEPGLETVATSILANKQARGALTQLLTQWDEMSEQPIVLILDEVDALVGDTLISLLRQIRASYAQRPSAFPQSLILCGVRDVRDYHIHTTHQEIITGGWLKYGGHEQEEFKQMHTQLPHSVTTCLPQSL